MQCHAVPCIAWQNISIRCAYIHIVIKTKKASSDSITFRLNSDVLEKMSKRAELKKISLNVLVNQTLQNYVDWDADSIKAGWIPVQRTTLTKLTESLDEKNISNIAKESAKLCGKNSILYMYGKYDIDHLLKNIRSKAQHSGYNIKEYDEDNHHEIVIQHDMGWKWSIFLKSYYQEVFHEVNQRVLFDYTDTTLIINLLSE
jgi:predicted transcriptional regulator